MPVLVPNLTILPPPQLRLWQELDATPEHFTLYGGTALALRLGHRSSVDFDFFSGQPFDPDELAQAVPYLKGAERVQVAPNTLKCRIELEGPVLVSFFGGLGLGQVAPRDQVEGKMLYVASLLDLAGTKVAVVQKRAEVKDYLDIDMLMRHGIDLPTALAAGMVVYGRSFNPMITLKALSFFDDLPALPAEVRRRLTAAVEAVNPVRLPVLTPYAGRTDENGTRTLKPLPVTQPLLNVARRVVWFKKPEEALADPVHFLAHVMTYGTVEDFEALDGIVGRDEYCEVLDRAPPGIFDPRSWAYWNLKCGRRPALPLPVRAGLQPEHPGP